MIEPIVIQYTKLHILWPDVTKKGRARINRKSSAVARQQCWQSKKTEDWRSCRLLKNLLQLHLQLIELQLLQRCVKTTEFVLLMQRLQKPHRILPSIGHPTLHPSLLQDRWMMITIRWYDFSLMLTWSLSFMDIGSHQAVSKGNQKRSTMIVLRITPLIERLLREIYL